MSVATTSSLTEIARERETFRYDPALVSNAIPNDPSRLIPSSQLRASSDATLTTFCQVAALRLGCTRALISLFDRDRQYVVAEATARLSLAPNAAAEPDHDGLWLCGTAFPRSFGVCESVLVCPATSMSGGAPVTVIDDLAIHDSFRERPFCHAWPGNRFYAGIPLQSPRGISIGVLCVFDTQPRHGLDPESNQVLRDVSLAIMSYLEGRRISDRHRQADRVTRGIRSFFDNRPSSTRLKDGEILTTESKTGTSNVHSNRDTTPLASGDTSLGPTSATPDQEANTKASRYARYPPSVVSPGLSAPIGNIQDRVQQTLARGADIFRNALEVDGLLILDASMSLPSHQIATTSNLNGHDSASSGEDEVLHGSGGGTGAMCSVLTSSVSSEVKRGGDSYFDHATLRERTLKKLLRHYPRGAIWNFDGNGAVDSSDVSSDEAGSGTSIEPSPRLSAADGLSHGGARKPNGSPSKLRTRRELRMAVFNLLPGARSVAFFPIWDAEKQRWFAGGFAHSERASRVLSVKAELSYLRAFGAVVMAEVSAIKARDVERSKLGVLSSVSHEFRSPLHGIILGTELLRDTRLDTFQEDALRSVEVCSRTLLDTIDQVLDWTKINHFASSLDDDPNHATTAIQNRVARSRQNNTEAGMMSITSNVDLATLIEDVVESVHAGHAFQNFSLARLDSSLKPQQADKWGVNIIVDFLPSASWVFHVQVGAIRRIVMNILGNSLKYTTSGSIYIRVEQLHIPQSKSRLLRLTIADTGCGISEDYLAHDVFTPFSQEDHMESGSGLGLSIVKRIAEGLRGMVEIQSEIGVGTTVRVSLPLEVGEEGQEAGRAPADISHTCTLPDEQELSPPQTDELRGLRVSLVGFQDCSDENCRGGLLGNPLSEKENMTSICRDWLGLQVIQPYNDYGISPDIALCDEYSFDQAILLTQANKSIPVVVVCQNAVVARRLAAISAQNEATSEQWIHFTYQPLGPRKLAGTLSRTLEHWMSRQSLPKGLILHDRVIKDDFCSLGRDTPITPPVVKEEKMFPIGSAHFQDGQAIPNLCLPHRVLQSPAATPVEKEDPFAPAAERRGTVFLLVDDNPINLKMLSTFMKKLGYPYDTATDGQQAVTSYQQQPERYKCVFMDISMPVMNGFEATRLIRTMEAEVSLPRCTIIALTGLASQESQQEAFVCGIDLFLTKPVKLSEIKQIIEAKQLT